MLHGQNDEFGGVCCKIKVGSSRGQVGILILDKFLVDVLEIQWSRHVGAFSIALHQTKLNPFITTLFIRTTKYAVVFFGVNLKFLNSNHE